MTGRGDHVSGDLSHMTGVHGKYKGLLHAWKKEDHLKHDLHSWKEYKIEAYVQSVTEHKTLQILQHY